MPPARFSTPSPAQVPPGAPRWGTTPPAVRKPPSPRRGTAPRGASRPPRGRPTRCLSRVCRARRRPAAGPSGSGPPPAVCRPRLLKRGTAQPGRCSHAQPGWRRVTPVGWGLVHRHRVHCRGIRQRYQHYHARREVERHQLVHPDHAQSHRRDHQLPGRGLLPVGHGVCRGRRIERHVSGDRPGGRAERHHLDDPGSTRTHAGRSTTFVERRLHVEHLRASPWDTSTGPPPPWPRAGRGTSAVQKTPNPGVANPIMLDAVSCAAPTACTAVGSSNDPPNEALIERYS